MESIGWTSDLMMRRLAGARVVDRGDHVLIHTRVNPGYRWGNFLLLRQEPEPAMVPHWIDTFERALTDAHHVAIGVDADPVSPALVAQFAELGFTGQRVAVLTTEGLAGGVDCPLGYECRLLASDRDWDAALQLRYDLEEEQYYRELGRRRHDELRRICQAGHGVWFGAFAGQRMCSGLGVFSDGSGIARFQHVATHAAHRRRGLARTLLRRATRHALSAMGASTAVIVADPGAIAIDLYRSVGFTDAHAELLWHRPLA